jgi:hypothetical protein
MGELVAAVIDLEVEVADSSQGERLPGLGWTLSAQAIETIRDIEENIRAAEQWGRALARQRITGM